MFIWIQTHQSPHMQKCETPFGNLIVASNWVKRKRVRTGHKSQKKRYKSATGAFVNAPTQGDGYKDTAGYKFTGICGINNNRKEFFGNNVLMVKKLVENHYRQILKTALLQIVVPPE